MANIAAGKETKQNKRESSNHKQSGPSLLLMLFSKFPKYQKIKATWQPLCIKRYRAVDHPPEAQVCDMKMSSISALVSLTHSGSKSCPNYVLGKCFYMD